MYHFLFGYMASFWGVLMLVISSTAFGLKAYDLFAKAWPATTGTGKFVTEGMISDQF